MGNQARSEYLAFSGSGRKNSLVRCGSCPLVLVPLNSRQDASNSVLVVGSGLRARYGKDVSWKVLYGSKDIPFLKPARTEQ